MFTDEMLFLNCELKLLRQMTVLDHTWLHLRKKWQVLNSNMLLVRAPYMNDSSNRDQTLFGPGR